MGGAFSASCRQVKIFAFVTQWVYYNYRKRIQNKNSRGTTKWQTSSYKTTDINLVEGF